MVRAYLSIGSNLEPAENVRKALLLLCTHVRITGLSTVYRTPAEGRPEQPDYYNCVAGIETDIPPLEFKLSVLRAIEGELGRSRTDDRFAARPIDLDLILYGDMIMKTPDLELPDPQILRRAFVAVPLQELSPHLVLPGSGRRIGEVAAQSVGEMMPLEGYTKQLREELRGHEHKTC